MDFDPKELIERFAHVIVDGEDLAAKHQKVTDALKGLVESLAPEIRFPEDAEEVKVLLTSVAKVVHAGIDREAAKAESAPAPSTAPEPTAGQPVTPGPIVATEPAPYADPETTPAPPAGFTAEPTAPPAAG